MCALKVAFDLNGHKSCSFQPCRFNFFFSDSLRSIWKTVPFAIIPKLIFLCMVNAMVLQRSLDTICQCCVCIAFINSNCSIDEAIICILFSSKRIFVAKRRPRIYIERAIVTVISMEKRAMANNERETHWVGNWTAKKEDNTQKHTMPDDWIFVKI